MVVWKHTLMAVGRKENRFSCVSAQGIVAPYCPVGEAPLVRTWILSFFFDLERDNLHHLVFFQELHSIALAHTDLSHKSACSSHSSSMHQFIWPFWPTFCTFLQIPAAQEAGYGGNLAYCEKIFLNSGPLFKISRGKDASLCSACTWNLPGSFSPNLSFSPLCKVKCTFCQVITIFPIHSDIFKRFNKGDARDMLYMLLGYIWPVESKNVG